MAAVDEQMDVLMRGVDYGDEGLRRQMERELRALIEQDRPLRVYFGIDPTATALTLGHTVPLRKLRQFQELGHHAIFLIGDYTALIGDPSDKNKLRPLLSTEDIKANEQTYFEQAAKVIDPRRTELHHNSEWLGKLSFPDIISLMSKFTVAEMLRRDNFRKRFDDGDAVFLHEFLYALMQGYDAYALECDVQVGGTEQLFNLMAGRKIQDAAGQKPHVPVTLPILVGLDGKARMSKSAGNHIGVSDSPDEQYGKTMSLPDDVLGDFFTLATNLPTSEVGHIIAGLKDGTRDPMHTKKYLARTIVSEFWGEAAARTAEERFQKLVQEKPVSREDLDEDQILEIGFIEGETYSQLLVRAGLATSRRAAQRLFTNGGVRRFSTPVVVVVLAYEPGKPAVEVPMPVGPLNDSESLANDGEIIRVGKRTYLSISSEYGGSEV